MKTTLTQARLQELLNYDPESGAFIWRVTRGRVKAGGIAGTFDPLGYQMVRIDRCRYMAHRLAWMYVTGAWPQADIDHIDGNPANNRFINLRDVSRTVNGQNQRRAKSHNKSGYLGVIPEGRWWAARIVPPGRGKKYLGAFATPELAHAAYLAAKRVMHVGCTI